MFILIFIVGSSLKANQIDFFNDFFGGNEGVCIYFLSNSSNVSVNAVEDLFWLMDVLVFI